MSIIYSSPFLSAKGNKADNQPCALSVIIPAYNEAARIARTIQETFACLQAFPQPFEIIVVDDGSRDRTAPEAEAAIKALCPAAKSASMPRGTHTSCMCPAAKSASMRARVLPYSPNQGKGWALRQGVHIARGKYIAFFDADLDIAPQHILDYYRVLQREKADAVIASKRHPESQLVYARSRVIISNIYYWFNRVVFRLDTKDTQTGMKLFRREILLAVLPRLLGKRFAFDLELLVNIRRIGGRIISQPVTITGHERFGRIGYLSLWHAFVDTLAIAYRVYILRYYNWRVIPKLPANSADSVPDQSIAVCVFSPGYGRRLEELYAHLRDTCGFTNPICIIAPKSGFALRDARVIAHSGRDLGAVAEHIAKAIPGAEAVVFLDERSRPGPDWLARFASYLELRPDRADSSDSADNAVNVDRVDRVIDAVSGPLGDVPGQSRASRLAMSVLQHILMPYFPVSRWNRLRQRWRSYAGITNLCVRTRVLRDMASGGSRCQVFDERFFSRERSILYSPDCVLGYDTPPMGPGAARELYRIAKRRGRCQLNRPEHLVCLRDYFPAFFLIVLVIGGIFSCISEIFWIYWRWVIVVWAAIVYLASGHLFKIHTALIVTAGVFLGNIISGFGFICGLFTIKKELSDDK